MSLYLSLSASDHEQPLRLALYQFSDKYIYSFKVSLWGLKSNMGFSCLHCVYCTIIYYSPTSAYLHIGDDPDWRYGTV